MPMFRLEANAAKFAFLLQRAGLLAKTAQRFNQTLAWAEAFRTCVRKSWGVEIFVHGLAVMLVPKSARDNYDYLDAWFRPPVPF
jgi:hypothetical protein